MGRSIILFIKGVCASKAQNIESGMYCRSPDKGKKQKYYPLECLTDVKSRESSSQVSFGLAAPGSKSPVSQDSLFPPACLHCLHSRAQGCWVLDVLWCLVLVLNFHFKKSSNNVVGMTPCYQSKRVLKMLDLLWQSGMN